MTSQRPYETPLSLIWQAVTRSRNGPYPHQIIRCAATVIMGDAMSIRKINSAFAWGSVENILALANLTFDFPIIKFEAPKDFMTLGTNFAPQRRAIVEDSELHQTARKLGVLFEDILPSSPQLFKSYGKRASEISQTEAINPKGNHKNGAFAAYVGTRATSIWVVAALGPAATGCTPPSMYASSNL